tara:strand:+ start:11743 stop:11922 length:180 start_codon:yes stop_codon:yes gene_type:complete
MKDWLVKINKDTSWTVQHRVTKEQRKMWSKKDVEEFLDWQENLDAQEKSRSSKRPANKA